MLTKRHFARAVEDVAAHGDNDVLPFDVDTRFIGDCASQLVTALAAFAEISEKKSKVECEKVFRGISIYFERLLAPAGPFGFRTTTKLHPVWNLYFNGIAAAIAELHEPDRSEQAHSYRYSAEGPALFDRERSWRSFREACLSDCEQASARAIVVQADISSFYDHVYHHRLENFLSDLVPRPSNIPTQVDVLLSQFANGRSFGLPVGGQAARVLAEVLLGSIDRSLTDNNIRWRRYVDDFVLIADSQQEAYRALGVLASNLSNLGLSLNRNKTTMLGVGHFGDYVRAQLDGPDGDSRELREIDLYFDPYSDNPIEEYESLRESVRQIDIERFLRDELEKGQPDGFLVSQVSRALAYKEPTEALSVCRTLLDARNLHFFRGNWPSIMRGISAAREREEFEGVHAQMDELLDSVPEHSSHVLAVHSNLLHYLRCLRFARTNRRASFLLETYGKPLGVTVRRACIDCWRLWKDRERFLQLRNSWSSMHVEEQRMLWLAAGRFGDDGEYAKRQVRSTLRTAWAIGMERSSSPAFADVYAEWANNES